MRKKEMFGWVKLLNPKNLEKEVDVYGYHFSWKTHILAIVCTLVMGGVIGNLFHLATPYLVVVLLVSAILLPVLILDMYRKMYEQKRFADAATYMEQMLYSFQKSGKVLLALQETRQIFAEGQMANRIEEAAAYLRAGSVKLDTGLLKGALERIESCYECPKMRIVHGLFVNAEEQGGDMEQSIMILLEDIELWKRRGYRLQAEKKRSHADNIISMFVAVVLCAVALYVLNAMKKLFVVKSAVDIFQIGVIQISSLCFLLFLLFVFWKSSKSLTCNWLTEDTLNTEREIKNSYHMVAHYSEKKERKKSICYGIPALIGAVPAFVFGKEWIAVGCLLVSIFLFFQHKVGYQIAKKDVTSEIYLALPVWLMEMALLLQSNNVQVSIEKSKEGAPAVLQEEIENLMERLSREPENLNSYTQFCSQFDVPEAQGCMKMLHAVSEMGAGNVKTQMSNLLGRVNQMQDIAEEIRNEKTAFQMKLIFSYPVIAATIKLLLDLTVGMAVLFQMLGSMGGM